MKKITFLLLFSFALTANAQYTWKVTPKVFSDEIGQSRTIVGIQCKDVTVTEIDTVLNKNRILFLCFVEDNGKIYRPRNINTSELVLDLVAAGVAPAAANAKVRAIMRALLVPTNDAEIRSFVELLAGLYGYTLAAE
jgi:hypothetical protein